MSKEYFNDVADFTQNGMKEALAMLIMDKLHRQDEKNKNRFPTYQDMELAITKAKHDILKGYVLASAAIIVAIMLK